MNNVNRITICKNNYHNQEDFENAVKKAIMVLLDNNYIMSVDYDANDKEMGIVVIDYDYADKEYGGSYPYWLLPEEFENIESREE